MSPDKEPKELEALMRIVESQLRDNDPPETRQTLERLKKDGFSEDEAKRLIRSVVAIEICDVLEKKKPFNYPKYIEALKNLPNLPWEE